MVLGIVEVGPSGAIVTDETGLWQVELPDIEPDQDDTVPLASGTVLFDIDGAPRVTITKNASSYVATVEVEGLSPKRGTNTDERAAGITSLDPPTVSIRLQRDPNKSMRALIDACSRAVIAASTSTTDGDTGGPGALILTHFHVSRAVRGALRLLQENI